MSYNYWRFLFSTRRIDAVITHDLKENGLYGNITLILFGNRIHLFYRISIMHIYTHIYTVQLPDFHGNLNKLERKSSLAIKTRKINVIVASG